ncbi:MAG TPA: hypothetical protein VN328_04970 [Thermodesulfovibrionales bacterium]|nr:hypothetical protein [Thermodesulfovibrionales bacterium]
MTKVVVNSGACGFSVEATAEKGRDKKIHISLETECEMVKKMLDDIPVLDVMSLFSGWLNNPVYNSAAKQLKHVSCPVPAGILKAVEVEAGMAVPKGVSIVFSGKKNEKK